MTADIRLLALADAMSGCCVAAGTVEHARHVVDRLSHLHWTVTVLSDEAEECEHRTWYIDKHDMTRCEDCRRWRDEIMFERGYRA